MRHSMRVAMLISYWDFWEQSVSCENFREDRLCLGREVEEILIAADMEVCYSGLVDSELTGRKAGSEIVNKHVDVIVLVQSLCSPPSYMCAALEKVRGIPLVIWAVQRENLLDAEFNAGHITANGATVGTPMLTNLLSREGRQFELKLGVLSVPSQVEQFTKSVRAAAIANHIREARVGRVGQPIKGYTCVDADAMAIRDAIGIEIVDIEPNVLRNRYLAVDAGQVREVEKNIKSEFYLPNEGISGLSESLKLVVALRDIDSEFSLDAGAMNCHIPELRYADDPGVTPCFALGCETSRGIPWVCSGDVITAVAMLVAKRISGAAFYHEIEGFDSNTGELGLANSGEHDLCWCKKNELPRVQENPWYVNDVKTGASAKFELEPGPATLVGFTPNGKEPSGFRFVAAQGYITDRSFPDNPSVGGAFKFCSDDVISAWSQWAVAGVNHHSALAMGHIADEVDLIAKFRGIGCVRIC